MQGSFWNKVPNVKLVTAELYTENACQQKKIIHEIERVSGLLRLT